MFALDKIMFPETVMVVALFLVVLSVQLVVCHEREILARRLFFLEWTGNQHRRAVHRLLPRLVPRPIAAMLDMSFEPQGWLCNNVAFGK